ncbi:uncharacterized protein LOC135694011 isoform X2 [Rhopilema esculentum]|uniref:uncharacterized protein LOC135694011 isoform X2 n=1 Tax=Rhopilema esculentum TaxID=499914 RepID=UPI0031CF3606
MYGSLDENQTMDEEKNEIVPLVTTSGQEKRSVMEIAKHFEDEFDSSFWESVSKLVIVLLDQECRKQNCVAGEKHYCKYGGRKKHFVDIEGVKMTLLHFVAKTNFVIIAKALIERFPGMLHVKTRGGDDKNRLPVEYALLNFHDDVASELIKNMHNERVRRLFQYDTMEDGIRFHFSNYIKNEAMQKTVIAVLDCMMSPDWPFIPISKDEVSEEVAWSKVPDIPIRYHVFYQILDGDFDGRPAKLKREHGGFIENEKFDHKSDSCFKCLVNSPHKDVIIRHPIVRLLADRKWSCFGEVRVRFFAILYLVFLFALSFALLGAVSSKDPRKYQNNLDYARMVFEAMSLFGAVAYLLLEVDQMTKERCRYLRDGWNFLDLFGILSLFCLIPGRILNGNWQWSLAALSYLVNFLRVFKYFPAWPRVGLYAKCLYTILLNDVSTFFVAYGVIMFAFGGSTYLALKASRGLQNVSGFGDIILREIRILADGQAFADSYDKFHVAVIVLILINMIVALIVMVNMLIAQLSNSYENALNEAVLQFDIDKYFMVSKLEQSHFRRGNLRIKYYTDGDYVNDMTKIKEIFDDWEKLKEQKNIGNLPQKHERERMQQLASKDRFFGVVI